MSSLSGTGMDNSKLMFFATGINPDDIVDGSTYRPQYMYSVTGLVRQKPSNIKLGVTVTVNGKVLSLFKYNSEVFAIASKCPHQGGPLGESKDIEEIVVDGDGHVCIKCPWHKYRFSLFDGSGVGNTYTAEVYPVQVRASARFPSGECFIGFASLNSNMFSSEDF